MGRVPGVFAGACAGLLIAAGVVCAAVPAGSSVGAFYYPWYGTPPGDGAWHHWAQSGRDAPSDIAAAYFPARGTYSSGDVAVVRAQMQEIASAGIDTVIVSWWGTTSVEHERLPLVAAEARSASLRVAIHVEPYAGRTAASTVADLSLLRTQGYTDFYVYDSSLTPDSEWAAALARVVGVRVFANTPLVGRAVAGGFDGLYTYDTLIHNGASFPRICAQARKAGVLCAPSVGPGFDARRATALPATRPRRNGATYDQMWRQAIKAGADLVTITSYNEWNEGTQIEPARAVGPPYESYEGAYGLTGRAAERAYLDRTAYWAVQYRS